MKIGIDMDGILADFNKSYCELAIKVTGRNLFPKLPYDPPCWYYLEPLGYTKDEESLMWDVIKEDTKFWECLPGYDDVDAICARLNGLQVGDHDVYFITNRSGRQAKRQTERWLQKHWVPNPTVLVSEHKGLAAAALELDLYIDDKPSNCDDVVKQRGLKTKTFLMDRSWNGEFTSAYITRVNSALEMLKEVK